MNTQVKLNDNQKSALEAIVAAGTKDASDLDGRAVRALATRELVKIKETKKGKFVSPTAKGKKALS